MAHYLMYDDDGETMTFEATSDEQALELAREELFYTDAHREWTIWPWASVSRAPDADAGEDLDLYVERRAANLVGEVEVAIDPVEPACPHGEHDWQAPHALVGGLAENPGVQGHGGGVVVHEACLHCGAQRATDTWATNPRTGEQGYRSLSYGPAGTYSVAELWRAELRRHGFVCSDDDELGVEIWQCGYVTFVLDVTDDAVEGVAFSGDCADAKRFPVPTPSDLAPALTSARENAPKRASS